MDMLISPINHIVTKLIAPLKDFYGELGYIIMYL